MIRAPQARGDVAEIERIAVPVGYARGAIDLDSPLVVQVFDATINGYRGWAPTARQHVAIRLDRQELTIGVEANVPTTFMHEPVMEPAQLDEVVALGFAAPGVVADVMEIGKRATTACLESAPPITGVHRAA